MFCKHCGMNIPYSTTRFCPHCGMDQGVSTTPQNQFTPQGNFSSGPTVSNHMGLAVVAILIGWFIPGAIALYYSNQVSKFLSNGNYQAAVNASNTARNWAWVGIAIGIMSWGAILSNSGGDYGYGYY